jgi:hypothetical protein
VAGFIPAFAMTRPPYVFARHSSTEGCRSNLGGPFCLSEWSEAE